MENQSLPERDNLQEIIAQLSAKIDELQKEVKASRKESKKTRKTVKALYHAITQSPPEEDKE